LEVISVRRQEAGGRRQEGQEFYLPKKKSKTTHIKEFSLTFLFLVSARVISNK